MAKAKKAFRVLAIESSCDESAAAVLDESQGLLAHELYSQIELHRIYGGVVPELASRDHVRRLLPLVRQALEQAGTTPDQLAGVAFTAGPGLIGALLTGAALARSLAYAWGVPAVGIHHLEGHLLAPLLEPEPPPFPHVALLVSGRTYPADRGRAASDDIASSATPGTMPRAKPSTRRRNCSDFPTRAARSWRAWRRAAPPAPSSFPRPMLDRPGLELSFSGLKTAVLHSLRGRELTAKLRADVARGVEEAIVGTLSAKAVRALDATGLDALVVSGGVSANQRLRAALTRRGQSARGAACTIRASSSAPTTRR